MQLCIHVICYPNFQLVTISSSFVLLSNRINSPIRHVDLYESLLKMLQTTCHYQDIEKKYKGLLTFLFEGEIFCQMSTFMISTK